jgi:hypothetical protein
MKISTLRHSWLVAFALSVAAPAFGATEDDSSQFVDDSIHLSASAPIINAEEGQEQEIRGAGTSNAFNDQANTPSGPGGYASGGQLPADPNGSYAQ